MWFLTFQALGEQPEVLGVEMVETLLAKALPALARKVWGASKELADAPAASAEELQSKFTLQPDVFGRTFHMAYGDQQQFNQGLNGLIGPPTLPLLEAMEAEVRARPMACSVKKGITGRPSRGPYLLCPLPPSLPLLPLLCACSTAPAKTADGPSRRPTTG